MQGPNAPLILSFLRVDEQFGTVALVSRACRRAAYALPQGVYRRFSAAHLEASPALRRFLALAEAQDPRSHTRALKQLWMVLNQPQLVTLGTWEGLAKLAAHGLPQVALRAVSRKLRSDDEFVPAAFLDCVSAGGDFTLYEAVMRRFAHRVQPGLLAVRNVLAYCVDDILGVVGPLFRGHGREVEAEAEEFRDFMAAAFNPAWLRGRQNRLTEIDGREVALPAAEISLARRVRFVRNLLLCPEFCDLLDRFRQSPAFRKVEMPRLMRELLPIPEADAGTEATPAGDAKSDVKEAKDDVKAAATAHQGGGTLAGPDIDGLRDAELKMFQLKFRNVAYAYYVHRFEQQDAAWRDAFHPDPNYVETARDVFLRGVYLQLLWLLDVHASVFGAPAQRASVLGELQFAGIALCRFPEDRAGLVKLARAFKKRLHHLNCDHQLEYYYDWAMATAWEHDKHCS